MSALFGVGAGGAAGAAGVEGATVPLLASLDLPASLLSEGFVSADESDAPSELFGA